LLAPRTAPARGRPAKAKASHFSVRYVVVSQRGEEHGLIFAMLGVLGV